MEYRADKERIASLMSDEDRRFYKDIFAPSVVAAPDGDAWGNLTVMPDGEIRAFGTYRQKNVFETDAERDYIASRDGGLSWKRHLVTEKSTLGASVYIPHLGKYAIAKSEEGKGTFLLLGTSPDDTSPEKIQISEKAYFDLLPPLALRTRDRVLLIGHEHRKELHPTAFFAVLMYADGDLRTWHILPLKPAPMFTPTAPHTGVRWQQNNRENTIAELSDGRLMMLSRTATDFHYISYSEDGGESFSDPVPSTFHGTATMPRLLRLSDGRLLFFWCNTQPLPEREDADGIWEDVFTNRDANHVAVSENDGKSWIGFREMVLNPHRNAPDYRSLGGSATGRDKSVHQFEALELPEGKIMVSFGQHEACRKILIFDLRWLYETSREENFLHGMHAISAQGYLESVLGCFRGSREDPDSFVGHCAYNRISTAVMMPSPADEGHEVLCLANSDDPRRLTPLGGAAWNFPAAIRARVTIRLALAGQGLRVSLLDRWLNPTDPTAAESAAFSFVLTKEMLHDIPLFADLRLDFDCQTRRTRVFVNDTPLLALPMQSSAPNGLCYLHLQTLPDTSGASGAMIAFLSAKRE